MINDYSKVSHDDLHQGQYLSIWHNNFSHLELNGAIKWLLQIVLRENRSIVYLITL